MEAGPTSASSRSGALGLTVAVHGTSLRVSLTNHGDDPLQAYFGVQSASGVHHDHLTAELAGETETRLLRFTGARDDSPIGIVELAPGAEVADELDLAAWATDPINGGTPLAAGAYALTATYRVERPRAWSGLLRAGPVRLLVG
jgi:hypothetical protein